MQIIRELLNQRQVLRAGVEVIIQLHEEQPRDSWYTPMSADQAVDAVVEGVDPSTVDLPRRRVKSKV